VLLHLQVEASLLHLHGKPAEGKGVFKSRSESFV
jgi:hypothetical protein